MNAPLELSAHSSVVGGSTAGIRLACNASRLEDQKVPRESSTYADRGTALHHVVEQAINGDLTDDEVLAQFTGVAISKTTSPKLKDMVHTIDLTAELLTAKVLPALAYLDEVVPRDARLDVEKHVPMTWSMNMVEHRDIIGMTGIVGASGTGDIFFDYAPDGRAGVIDWKFGDGIMVSAENNDQMRFYLVLGIMNGLLPVQDEYEAHIFQPAESREPADYGSMAIYRLDDLVRFSRDLADAINGPIVYNFGEHCAKCKGKLTCPLYQSKIRSVIETDVAGLSGQELAKMLKLVPSLMAFATEVKAAALRNAQLGVEIPGYALEPALGNSAWRDEDSAWKALGRMGLAADERTVKKTVSPTAAMTMLKRIGTEVKQMERFSKTHIFRPDNGERLVEASSESEAKGAVKRLAEAMKARGH